MSSFAFIVLQICSFHVNGKNIFVLTMYHKVSPPMMLVSVPVMPVPVSPPMMLASRIGSNRLLRGYGSGRPFIGRQQTTIYPVDAPAAQNTT